MMSLLYNINRPAFLTNRVYIGILRWDNTGLLSARLAGNLKIL